MPIICTRRKTLNIVLCALNARYTHQSPSLFCLRNAIEDLPAQVRILQLSINMNQLEILRELMQLNPDLLGVSVSIWNSAASSELVRSFKKLRPDCRVVLGGPEITSDPARWSAALPEADWLVAGEGEQGFADLVRQLCAEKTPTERILNSVSRPFAAEPLPYRPEDRPLLAHRYLYYESSRGCRFNCGYCLSSLYGQHCDEKPAELVVRQVAELLEFQPQIIKFVDRSFNGTPTRARAVWKALSELDTEVRFHFEVHPSLLEAADIELLRSVPSGRFQFEIGLQSFCEPALRAVQRAPLAETKLRLLEELCSLKNIHHHLDLIAGLPHETLDDFARSFDTVYRLRPDHFQVGFLKLLPGTPLHAQRECYGLLASATAPYRILRTAAMSFEELLLLEDIAALIDVCYNGGGYEVLAQTAWAASSPFAVWRALAEYYREHGYDFSARERGKVQRRVDAFLAAMSPKNI